MKVLTAKVVDGRLDIPEGVLPEGATVILLVPGAEEGFQLPPEAQALLLEAMDQAERGEVTDGWKLLEALWDGEPRRASMEHDTIYDEP